MQFYAGLVFFCSKQSEVPRGLRIAKKKHSAIIEGFPAKN
jgi:hypothetical protein